MLLAPDSPIRMIDPRPSRRSCYAPIIILTLGLWAGGFLTVSAAELGQEVQRNASVAHPPPSVGPAVIKLHELAMHRLDLWTALQLEAYGRRLDLHLKPMLSRSFIYGDPLFAFPRPILRVWDHGHAVGVLTAERFYTIAEDGRPLALSVPLALVPDSADLSFDGRYLALLQAHGAAPTGGIQVCVQHLPQGDRALSTTLDVRDPITGDVVVASDGSAIVFGVGHEAGAKVADGRILLYEQHGGLHALPGLAYPVALGHDGVWLIASQVSDGHAVLVDASGRHPLDDKAIGGGMALVILDHHPMVISPLGQMTPLTLPKGVTKVSRPLSMGGCLMLQTGDDFTLPSSTDLLGKQVRGGGRGGRGTTLLYRWHDLAQDPAAPPCRIIVSDATISYSGTSLITWSGRDVSEIDGLDPSLPTSHVCTASAPVTWAGVGDYDGCCVHLAAQRRIIYDVQGREVWSGDASDMHLCANGWMAIRDASGWQLVRADLDAAKRTHVPLNLPPGSWTFEADALAPRMLVRDDHGHWEMYDTGTGAVLAHCLHGNRPLPELNVPFGLPGRFCRISGRLIARDAIRTTEPQPIHPIDAWRAGRSVMIIDGCGSVLLGQVGGNGLLPIGDLEGAHGFALRGDHSLGIVDAADHILAGFTASPHGPMLVENVADHGQASVMLGGGLWRVDDHGFAPPNLGSLTWNDHVGFTPIRFRGPPGGGLMAITATLVIDLDPHALSVIARPLH